MKTGGIGASLSAVIHESLFNELDHEVGPGRCLELSVKTVWHASLARGSLWSGLGSSARQRSCSRVAGMTRRAGTSCRGRGILAGRN